MSEGQISIEGGRDLRECSAPVRLLTHRFVSFQSMSSASSLLIAGG